MSIGDPKTVIRCAAILTDMGNILASAEGATEVSWWIEWLVDYTVEKWVENPKHVDEDFSKHLAENLTVGLKRYLK